MSQVVDLDREGIFKLGMTGEEIREYLRKRSRGYENFKKKSTDQLEKIFWNVAGPGNTLGVVGCPECKKSFGVMYRYDVKRFADAMFDRKPTYFD